MFFIMSSCVLISLEIISSWRIWFISLLHYTLKLDASFNFVIISVKQLLLYWLYIIIILTISGYIFIIRLKEKTRSIVIFDKFEEVKNILLSWEISDLIIYALVLILWLICGFLLAKFIYVNMKMRLLALYMYYYQYDVFQNWVFYSSYLKMDFLLYLTKRVSIFTDNVNIIRLFAIIWPGLFIWLEPRIWRIIIPYLMIFDFITQNGLITKVFGILPWYYIYSIIRTSWKLFRDFFKPTNTAFSKAIYKSREVNGKSYRWVNTPTSEETDFYQQKN